VDVSRPAAPAQRAASELGRQLAAAAGFRVITSSGAEIGQIAHVRYEQRIDRPDELIIRTSRFMPWARRTIPFSHVQDVQLRSRTVVVSNTPD
jgi:hypothetical protein